jgi:hypothetical protein
VAKTPQARGLLGAEQKVKAASDSLDRM